MREVGEPMPKKQLYSAVMPGWVLDSVGGSWGRNLDIWMGYYVLHWDDMSRLADNESLIHLERLIQVFTPQMGLMNHWFI